MTQNSVYRIVERNYESEPNEAVESLFVHPNPNSVFGDVNTDFVTAGSHNSLQNNCVTS